MYYCKVISQIFSPPQSLIFGVLQNSVFSLFFHLYSLPWWWSLCRSSYKFSVTELKIISKKCYSTPMLSNRRNYKYKMLLSCSKTEPWKWGTLKLGVCYSLSKGLETGAEWYDEGISKETLLFQSQGMECMGTKSPISLGNLLFDLCSFCL